MASTDASRSTSVTTWSYGVPEVTGLLANADAWDALVPQMLVAQEVS